MCEVIQSKNDTKKLKHTLHLESFFQKAKQKSSLWWFMGKWHINYILKLLHAKIKNIVTFISYFYVLLFKILLNLFNIEISNRHFMIDATFPYSIETFRYSVFVFLLLQDKICLFSFMSHLFNSKTSIISEFVQVI